MSYVPYAHPVTPEQESAYTDTHQFEIDVYSEDASKQPVKDLVRSKVVPQLRKSLAKLGPVIMAEHGKDIQHGEDHNPLMKIAPAKVYSSSSVNKSETKSSATADKTSSGSLVNTVTITDSTEFRTTAEELFKTFTDPQRLAAFTRSPPKNFTGAKPGGTFELFGGNVSGEFTKLEEPTHIVQKWRLGQWPAGHYSTLSIWFDQNDVDAVTVMRVEWKGVPVGSTLR